MPEYAARLRAERKRQRRRQHEVAEAAGVSQQAISFYEAGTRWPTPRHQLAIAEALRCQIGELFPVEPETDDRERELATA